MFISGLLFCVTLSRRVKYVTMQFVQQQTAQVLANAINLVVGLYLWVGFVCQAALMEREFEKVKQWLINIIELNINARNEQMLNVEQKIKMSRKLLNAPLLTCPIWSCLQSSSKEWCFMQNCLWMHLWTSRGCLMNIHQRSLLQCCS